MSTKNPNAQQKVSYYYTVVEYVSVQDAKPYEYIVEFKGDNLAIIRNAAYQWYFTRLKNIHESRYVLPVSDMDNTFTLKSSEVQIGMCLVKCVEGLSDLTLYTIEGDSATHEDIMHEREVLKQWYILQEQVLLEKTTPEYY
jgi:hypothetical protein